MYIKLFLQPTRTMDDEGTKLQQKGSERTSLCGEKKRPRQWMTRATINLPWQTLKPGKKTLQRAVSDHKDDHGIKRSCKACWNLDQDQNVAPAVLSLHVCVWSHRT